MTTPEPSLSDHAKLAAGPLIRCMGGNRCRHEPGTCTASNTVHQNGIEEAGLTTPEPSPSKEALAAAIVRDVAELPDRTSPDDWPDAMLVTAEELTAIVERHLDAFRPAPVDNAWADVEAKLKWLCHYDEVWPLIQAAMGTSPVVTAPIDTCPTAQVDDDQFPEKYRLGKTAPVGDTQK